MWHTHAPMLGKRDCGYIKCYIRDTLDPKRKHILSTWLNFRSKTNFHKEDSERERQNEAMIAMQR